jgi:hypothetical protein
MSTRVFVTPDALPEVRRRAREKTLVPFPERIDLGSLGPLRSWLRDAPAARPPSAGRTPTDAGPRFRRARRQP